MYLFWYIIVIVIYCSNSIKLTRDSQQSISICMTPDGKMGRCMLFENCTHLYNTKLKNHDPAILAFLRQHHCGFEDHKAKVCCESEIQLLPNTETCGIHVEDKIIGGEETKINEFPWLAIIFYKDKENETLETPISHGVLINSRYILTTATTVQVEHLQLHLDYVRLGEHDLSTDIDCIKDDCTEPVEEVTIEKIVLSGSDSWHGINDIALLRLSRVIKYTDSVQPICLPFDNNIAKKRYRFQSLYITGWGSTSESAAYNRSLSKLKQKITLRVQPQSVCNRALKKRMMNISDSQLCAGGAEDRDTCFGDVGIPLMALEYVNGRKNWYAIGVMSYTFAGCGQKGKPSVYLRVASYIDWIIKNITP